MKGINRSTFVFGMVAACACAVAFGFPGAQQSAGTAAPVERQAAAPAKPVAPALPPARIAVVPKQPYQSDHAEMLAAKIEANQAKAQNLIMRYQQMLEQDPEWKRLSAETQGYDQQLTAWENEVRKANGWGPEVTHDRGTGAWMKPAAAPAAK